MAKSENTFIPLPVNERELAIQDLAFSSNSKNDKAIKYAIECIDKLAKIEYILNKESDGYIQNNPCLREIREVLKKE